MIQDAWKWKWLIRLGIKEDKGISWVYQRRNASTDSCKHPSVGHIVDLKMSGSNSDLSNLELQEIQEYLVYLSQLKTSEGFRDLFQNRRCHLLCSHCDMVVEGGSEIRGNVWAQRKAKFCTLMGKLATQRFAYVLIFASLSALLVSNFLESWERSFENPDSQ